MLEDDLQHLGLSEKEAKVYLAALELGTDTVQNIAKKAKVKRVTTYVILKSLMKKGLASSVEKGNKAYFVAEDPDRLTRFIDQQIKDLDAKKGTIKPLLSELKLIHNAAADKPIVRFYEGPEGIDALMSEFMRESKREVSSKPDKDSDEDRDVLYLAYSRDLLTQLFSPEQLERSRSVRLKMKTFTKVIYNTSGEAIQTDLSKRIQVSEHQFPIPCDIAVYKDQIRLISLSTEPTAILIIDKNLAQGLRSLFKLAFKASAEVAK